MPAPTIRSWERRHSLSTVARDARGRRCYTPDDVAVLRRMRDQRANGTTVVEAVTAATTPPPLELCQQLLAHAHTLDGAGISAVLDLSVQAHGLPTTLDEVLLPSMRELGEQWSEGHSDIVHEHQRPGLDVGEAVKASHGRHGRTA